MDHCSRQSEKLLRLPRLYPFIFTGWGERKRLWTGRNNGIKGFHLIRQCGLIVWLTLCCLVVAHGWWLYSKRNARSSCGSDCNKTMYSINRFWKLLSAATFLARIVSILLLQDYKVVWGRIKWGGYKLKQSMWVHSLVHTIILIDMALKLWQRIINLRSFGTSR